LEGKVVLLTGAAGNIGETISRRCLDEGAILLMCGRNREKLEGARRRLLAATRRRAADVAMLVFDAGDPSQVRHALAEALERFGRLDVVVNNAGSAGPKQPLTSVPLDHEELAALRAAGGDDSETVGESINNLLGVAWHVARAAVPHLRAGGTIINVSTIFSRTEYYGRTAYTVPKAALNALSRQLARELGPRGIRVNTIFPGPIASERIDRVFAAMDSLRGAEPGHTRDDVTGLMTLHRPDEDGTPTLRYPTTADVAETVVFLGSDASAAFTAHGFEVTHGMAVRQESRSTWLSRPELRTVDGTGLRVFVAAGDQVADALALARVQSDCGAEVLLGLGSEEGVQAAREALEDTPRDRRIVPVLCDRRRHATITEALRDARQPGRTIHGAIILPFFGPWRYRDLCSTATDRDVSSFLEGELGGAIALGRELTRLWAEHPPAGSHPHVVFVSNGDDGHGNRYADLLRSALEELARVWRGEAGEQVERGHRVAPDWVNQIIRWTNAEEEGLPFAGGQTARLLYTQRRINSVTLYTPPSIVDATGARKAGFGWMESLMGLHLGKVALITGGSAGIGGQLARLLAIGGARVMICARRADQLAEMRDLIVRELTDIGYYDAASRVTSLPDVDVGNETALRGAVDATLARYGHIDYLINNAGIAGAEQMVVDMTLDEWRTTLSANLLSNYSLIEKVVPLMKRRGSGYILNVSSYFGGEKFIAVPYPNRADYAVSKAGQRALTENLAEFVGPEIQINAIAPGPVDGDRLRGTGGKAGLFSRRGRLILENRRLNAVHAAIVHSVRAGLCTAAEALDLLAPNELYRLLAGQVPEPLRRFAEQATKEALHAEDDPSDGRFVMDVRIAARLVARLRQAGLLLKDGKTEERFGEAWQLALPVPPAPFVSPAAVLKQAEAIGKGVLGMLHLRNMPTETEVALATVYFMADRAVSGETFQPSGGLHQERTITERELFGRAKPERLFQMHGETVWLIGEHLTAHLAQVARRYLVDCEVERVVLLTRTAEAGEAIVAALEGVAQRERIVTLVMGDDVEAGMDEALRNGWQPAAVVSTPTTPVPRALFGLEGNEHLDAAGFADLVEGNLTFNFRVARKASLLDGARLVLVTPDVPLGGSPSQFAMANFIKTTLHALTATLGVENERLVHGVPVNQINLTRRVRTEEPRNPAEQEEEIDRFAHAVLLATAPFAPVEQSRYRARIYRGLAITV
jgi:malonyl-CoA reductase/3-hydroxypropionate dehydrogenase (NADP+)